MIRELIDYWLLISNLQDSVVDSGKEADSASNVLYTFEADSASFPQIALISKADDKSDVP